MASAGPPPDALYLLRGQNKAVNCVAFVGDNLLATGCVCWWCAPGRSREGMFKQLLDRMTNPHRDADGVLKIWDLKRRRAVFTTEAHERGMLEVLAWGQDLILTYGLIISACPTLSVWH